MKKNLGNTDKIIRTIVGIALICGGIYYGTLLGITGIIIGIVLVLTALFSFCPIYKLCGCNSCKDDTCDKPEA